MRFSFFTRPALMLGLCLLAGPAFAHAHLKAAVPAVDGTVNTAPAAVDLTFTEGVNPKFSSVTVTGPDGTKVKAGTPELAAGGDTTLHVPLPAGLAAGAYKVEWHALAVDGHKSSGSYGFTIAP